MENKEIDDYLLLRSDTVLFKVINNILTKYKNDLNKCLRQSHKINEIANYSPNFLFYKIGFFIFLILCCILVVWIIYLLVAVSSVR